jgi:hypothetical protein
MKTNGVESAFPEVREVCQFNSPSFGLSKLEYFASMMMQAMIASSTQPPIACAKEAVEMANALIEVLNEKKDWQ